MSKEGNKNQNKSTGESFLTLGCILAVVISYAENHSILWAIFHGLCSWLYVIYYMIVY